jgi:hypothetical protein
MVAVAAEVGAVPEQDLLYPVGEADELPAHREERGDETGDVGAGHAGAAHGDVVSVRVVLGEAGVAGSDLLSGGDQVGLAPAVGVATEGVNVTREVVGGAVAATEEVGIGLILSAKSVAKGVVLGVGDVGGDVVDVARVTVKALVIGASDVGADAAAVARGAVDGVVEAVSEAGGNVGRAATAATEGALNAAGRVGSAAVTAVRDTLVLAATGIKDILSCPAASAYRARNYAVMSVSQKQARSSTDAASARRPGQP